MAPRKRARTAASPSSSASSAAAPKITLSGGEAHHSSLVALWRKEKLTDIAVCAEGVEFKAHRAALASSSGYFLSLFDSGMRDAASATHAIEGLRSPVLEALLGFVYEGSCQVEAGLLTEMLDASARLVVDPLKAACAYAIQAQLAPSNALDVWRIADLYTLPVLEKAAVTCALGGFGSPPRRRRDATCNAVRSSTSVREPSDTFRSPPISGPSRFVPDLVNSRWFLSFPEVASWPCHLGSWSRDWDRPRPASFASLPELLLLSTRWGAPRLVNSGESSAHFVRSPADADEPEARRPRRLRRTRRCLYSPRPFPAERTRPVN